MPRNKPSGMPATTADGKAREELSLWMKDRFEAIESEAERRIELLRTIGEHPSPIFARLVKKFAGLGIARAHIAKLLDIGVGTLMEHYADEMELGVAETNAMVATNMLKIATSETNPAAGKVGMSWLDRRGGEPWRAPAQKVEVKSGDAQPPIIDSSKLTYDERQQMRAMLERISNGGEGDPIQPDENDPVIA